MLEYAEGMVNDVKILLVVEIISNKKFMEQRRVSVL